MAEEKDDYAVKAAKEWLAESLIAAETNAARTHCPHCTEKIAEIRGQIKQLAAVIRRHVEARPGYRNMDFR